MVNECKAQASCARYVGSIKVQRDLRALSSALKKHCLPQEHRIPDKPTWKRELCMIFESTESYISTDELSMAVDASVRLERPLLIKGEPGTGKTMLAIEVAKSLGMPLLEWHIKSTTKAVNGLYEYDAVSRLRDSQLGDDRVNDIANYIKKGKLWEAFESEERVVLLIDEIDKADIEFPNDLLQEIDRMEFLFTNWARPSRLSIVLS